MLLLALSLLAGGLAGCDESSSSPAPSLDPTDTLIETLRTGTRSERYAAANDLADLGDPAAIPALVEALEDESWDVRWRAAEALIVVHDERAVEPLVAFVATPPAAPAVAEIDLDMAHNAYLAAIEALGAIGDARAVPRLVEIAAVEDWSLESGAAEDALAAIGEDALPGLEQALAGADAAQAAVIVRLLASAGDAALDALLMALGDERVAVRLEAAGALGGYGEPAVEPLLGALKDHNGKVAAAAAESLGEIGDARATESLVKALSDGDTRPAAVRALVLIHRDDATPLVKYLKAEKTVGVYRPLIRLGQEDTVAALVKALKSFGTKSMGEAYLNCGNGELEKAAKQWAKAHGYTVVSSPGSGEEQWGGG